MSRPKWRKRVEGRLGEWLFRRFQKKVSKMRPEKAEEWGQRLGRTFAKLIRSRRERTLSNLALAFPEASESERQLLMRRCFEHWGIIMADFLQSPSKDRLIQTTEIVGREFVDSALAEGKGAIFVSGHFGHFERTSILCAFLGYAISVVARDVDDEGVQGMVKAARSASGVNVLSRGSAARELLRALKRGELIGLLPDQNDSEVFVPFFGHLAGTVLGPGVLHKRTGAPVIPVTCKRVGTCKYLMEVFPPLVPEAGTGVEEGMMRAIHKWLEGEIRRCPEQYLWFHDRWRNARKQGFLEP